MNARLANMTMIVDLQVTLALLRPDRIAKQKALLSRNLEAQLEWDAKRAATNESIGPKPSVDMSDMNFGLQLVCTAPPVPAGIGPGLESVYRQLPAVGLMLLDLGDQLAREGRIYKSEVQKAVFHMVMEGFMHVNVSAALLYFRDLWRKKACTAAGGVITMKKLMDAEAGL